MSDIGRFIKNVVLPVGVFAVAAFCTTKAIAKVNETKGTSETINDADTEEKTVEVAEVVEAVKETVKKHKLPIIVAGSSVAAAYMVYKYAFSPEAIHREYLRYCEKHDAEIRAEINNMVKNIDVAQLFHGMIDALITRYESMSPEELEAIFGDSNV